MVNPPLAHKDVDKELAEILNGLVYKLNETKRGEATSDSERNEDASVSDTGISSATSNVKVAQVLDKSRVDTYRAVVGRFLKDPPTVETLSAFGSVVDSTYFAQDQLNDLRNWLEIQAPSHSGVPKSGKTANSIMHPDDIKDVLCAAMNGEGGKSRVDTPSLRAALVDGSFPATRKSLGGLPAIVGNTLSLLGTKSCFYSLYHGEGVRSLITSRVSWLELAAGDNKTTLVHIAAREEARSEHPVRHGVALAYDAGASTGNFCTQAQLKGAQVKKTDRQLLVLQYPIGNRNWGQWYVAGKLAKHDAGEQEWPTRPGFFRWQVLNNELRFEYADDALESLGMRYGYLILSGPQLGDALKDGFTQTMKQLRVIRGSGSVTHLELSGYAKREDDGNFGPFSQDAKDTFDSIGVNADELPSYFRLATRVSADKWPDQKSRESASEPPQRLREAVAVARALDIQRLYVHGNDIDIILRRRPRVGVGERAEASHMPSVKPYTEFADRDPLVLEAISDLFAKAAVLAATLQRNQIPPAEAVSYLPLGYGDKTIKAMTGMVIAARGQVSNSDSGVAMVPHIALDVYEDYDAVFVPCLWIPSETALRNFSATGAGDITSGVSIVYSGFHMTRNSASKNKDAM